MSKGHLRNQERHRGLSLFGKDLVRRCSSHCELCDAQGVRLEVYEVPPLGSDPDFSHCIMICQTCAEQLGQPKLCDTHHWRCLYSSIWSTVPAVKVISVAMLKKLSGKTPWATELLEQVYLEKDESQWAEDIVL